MPEKQTRIIKDSDDRYSLLNPTFFIFGEKDVVIALDQVAELEQKLKQHCKVDYVVKVFPAPVGLRGCIYTRSSSLEAGISDVRKDSTWPMKRDLALATLETDLTMEALGRKCKLSTSGHTFASHPPAQTRL
ncbi:hypothetical protein Y1Q_0022657 [Alligator mississippiensis]|uniref:Uncharacterized protein n=1 Tax=Alligator mississippiensis TaxID=8496 RepID=A0A151PHN0_ALLMI|nr:hypothetical protein Y1Q_0022657 [Alligator mississippiensis]